MSEDGYLDGFEEPIIEVQINTLMGTTFDIKVSLNDTVGDIKKKICRVEGIPVYQQNLIYQSEELRDTVKLCDSGIRNGSVLILVSAMRGGPISTRRLSVSYEHVILKELKDLLDNTRDEVAPGSKVSVLVFKEGDFINLLRVVENEDGSYSPYNENPISPPSRPSQRDNLAEFERLVEEIEMCVKISALRKKMREKQSKQRRRPRPHPKSMQEETTKVEKSSSSSGSHVSNNNKPKETKSDVSNSSSSSNRCSYLFLEECAEELLDNVDLTIFERNLDDQDNQSESEEIALKDKHRTKPKVNQPPVAAPKPSASRSLYNERRSYSFSRHNYVKMSKRGRESHPQERPFDQAKEKGPGGSYTVYSRDRIESASSTGGDLSNDESLYSDGWQLLDEEVTATAGTAARENPYLLEGLNWMNKLPDLRILDTDEFLINGSEDGPGLLEAANSETIDDMNTFLNLPTLNGLESFAGASSACLPNLVNGRNGGDGAFGSLTTPNISIGSRLDGRQSNSTPLPLSNSNYSASVMNPMDSLDSSLSSANSSLTHRKSSQYGSYKTSQLNNFDSLSTKSDTLSDRLNDSPTGSSSVEEVGAKLAEQLQLLDDDPYPVSARNQLRLTRLVLAASSSAAEGRSERPKSSPPPGHIELGRAHALWQIHERTIEPSAAACKVGVLKRRQEVDYVEESQDANLKPDLANNLGNYSDATAPAAAATGVRSGSNFYLSQYLSTPSAIPPQYAPKHQLEHHPNQSKCYDWFVNHEPRSPLYSRRKNWKDNIENREENCSRTNANADNACSNIQRIKNDEGVFGANYQHLLGSYNLGCAENNSFETLEENKKEIINLPPVIKKKSRCNECNKRLNITNIYDCRCGRIFCSQHRYSEAHSCTYDYKTEGRKIIERQNPLVTAEKVRRI